ncbi:MAG: DUF1571 domain-containing protein [Thermoguttaceae bacterium]
MKRNLALIAVVLLTCPAIAWGQQPVTPQTVAMNPPAATTTAATAEHPLIPVIRWAERGRPEVAALKDYTALVTKQEQVGGEIQEPNIMELKVRHQPFSVYLKFRYPKAISGRQAIYVEGKDDNKVIAHGVGMERALGTQKLDPEGFIAMRGQRYPITKIGLLNLVDELLLVGRADSKLGECDVKYFNNVTVDNRACTLIQVTHPTPRKEFRFNIARIFVDTELNLPIRYESYEWPKKEGEEPILLEAYTYSKLQMNVGLTDKDFDSTNPEYKYP